jgi:predicted ribosome quality control (RQC) complex YloA/Tae2 family protein
MRIVIDTRKTVEQNAASYFEHGKKLKKKLEGARRALEMAQSRIAGLAEETVKEAKAPKEQRKLEWYEKLRWFISSDGILCIGGRDSTTNEVVVKKHADKGDIVLHTDMAGAPFVVVKAGVPEVPMTTIEEAGQFCAAYSRAWKLGLASVEVFYVTPDQLSKTPNPGEFLPKGAFVVRGQVKYVQPPVEIAIGKMPDGRVMAGAQSAVLKSCGRGYVLVPGNEKTSDVAKHLAQLLEADVDDLVPLIPAGGVKLGKEIKARTASR